MSKISRIEVNGRVVTLEFHGDDMQIQVLLELEEVRELVDQLTYAEQYLEANAGGAV